MSFFKNTFRALTETERRIFWGAVALVALGVIGLIVLFVKDRTVVVPAHNGTYTEGMAGQPSYVNPVLAATDEDQALTRLTFADLQTLADSIQTTPNGATVAVHLKEGSEWSDGQPLTSDDVIFTLQSIQDPDSHSPLAGLYDGVTADRVSELEVDFHLSNLALASAIPSLAPLPQHIFNGIPPANWRLSDYNLHPVGSGPYVYGSENTGSDGFISQYRLNVNAHYTGTAPYVQQVNVLFFHTTDDVIAAFNDGRIQGFGTTDSSLLGQIQRPYALTRYTTPTVYGVFWNDTANPALGPSEVRIALDMVVDRNALLKTLGAFGEVANGPFPPALFAPASAAAGAAPVNNSAASSSASSTAALTDTQQAAQLLTTNGWQQGSDGVWAKTINKATVRLAFTLTVPDIGFLKTAANSLVSQWHAFGADVTLNIVSPDQSLLTLITNRSYDGLLFGNTVRGSGDLYPFWDSAERFAPGLNLAIYDNPHVDTLLTAIRTDKTATAQQKDMQSVATAITNNEPAVFLFSSDDLFVTSKDVQGVSGGFLEDPADRLLQLPQWYVATTRQLK